MYVSLSFRPEQTSSRTPRSATVCRRHLIKTFCARVLGRCRSAVSINHLRVACHNRPSGTDDEGANCLRVNHTGERAPRVCCLGREWLDFTTV